MAAEQYDYLRRVAHRWLNDEEDARDAVQEALLLAWRFRGDCRGQWEHWLCETTANVARTILRTRHRQMRRKPAWEYSVPRCDTVTPESVYILRERNAGIRRAVARLPRILREAVELVDLNEIPPSDAASALGIGLLACRSRLHRARQMLTRSVC